MRGMITAAIMSLALAAPAQASGALWCSVDDANWTFDVESGVTHGLGGPLFNLRASAELKDKRVMPELRKLELKDKLVHSWVYGETKLYFYSEIEKTGNIYSADIIIDTKAGEDESESTGTYTVITSNEAKPGEDGRVELTGPITCGGE